MKNNLIIKTILSLPKDTNVYLLVNKTEAAVVDAGDCVDAVQESLKDLGATLKYILITHGHSSHISSLSRMKNEIGGTICLHTSDLDLLRQQENGLEAGLLLNDGQSLKLADATIKVLHTPGHTMAPSATTFGRQVPSLQGIRCSKVNSERYGDPTAWG